MAVAVTMSSKNQIVVPSEACEKLHLAPGAKLPVIAKLSTPRVLPCSERLSVCRMREIRTYGLMRRSRETCPLLYRCNPGSDYRTVFSTTNLGLLSSRVQLPNSRRSLRW